MPEDKNIIETKGITKYFGPVKALENVDFELKKNEVLGLVGDNGAGKSTLIKILSGAYLPDSGTIKVYNKTVDIKNPRDAFALGVETIYQDLALYDTLNFTKNIFAGREYLQRGVGKIFNVVDEKRMRKEKALQSAQEEVRRTEQEYEQFLKTLAEKARPRVPKAVERVIDTVLPH